MAGPFLGDAKVIGASCHTLPNKAVDLTAYSLPYAAASGSSSPLAFGGSANASFLKRS